MYRGRFAPSPSGPLHIGSLATAMASYLDAKAHQGKWLLRIEDIDEPRCQAAHAQTIAHQLHAYGMQWDGPIVYQSHRRHRYQQYFEQLQAQQLIYGCNCTRQQVSQQAPLNAIGEHPYQGHCRALHLTQARTWRLCVPDETITVHDRWQGTDSQNVKEMVGDYIIRRADGLFSYQFVVVIDDIEQEITHIVRGNDLFTSTARQIVLAQLLHHPYPTTLHIPLLYDASGRKISKQNHAPAIPSDVCTDARLRILQQAWTHLGFAPIMTQSIPTFWHIATHQWSQRFLQTKLFSVLQ